MNSLDRSTVFTVEKKHAWKEVLLRYTGVSLILLVIVGTITWFLVSANFRFDKVFSAAVSVLKPQVNEQEKVNKLSKEEEVKGLIEKDSLFQVSELAKTSEGDIVLTAKEGFAVIFAVEKSLTDQVATLQTILSKARIDNKALKKVDFRFDKTVVEY
jgi:hypothetical protein